MGYREKSVSVCTGPICEWKFGNFGIMDRTGQGRYYLGLEVGKYEWLGCSGVSEVVGVVWEAYFSSDFMDLTGRFPSLDSAAYKSPE